MKNNKKFVNSFIALILLATSCKLYANEANFEIEQFMNFIYNQELYDEPRKDFYIQYKYLFTIPADIYVRQSSIDVDRYFVSFRNLPDPFDDILYFGPYYIIKKSINGYILIDKGSLTQMNINDKLKLSNEFKLFIFKGTIKASENWHPSNNCNILQDEELKDKKINIIIRNIKYLLPSSEYFTFNNNQQIEFIIDNFCLYSQSKYLETYLYIEKFGLFFQIDFRNKDFKNEDNISDPTFRKFNVRDVREDILNAIKKYGNRHKIEINKSDYNFYNKNIN